jgi:hypothetical protein
MMMWGGISVTKEAISTAKIIRLPPIRRPIGLIDQCPAPFPMTILDDVSFGARANWPFLEILTRYSASSPERGSISSPAIARTVLFTSRTSRW